MVLTSMIHTLTTVQLNQDQEELNLDSHLPGILGYMEREHT